MVSRRRLRVAHFAVSLCVAVSIAGCQSAFDWNETSPSPAPADLVGVWEAHSAHHQTATVQFSENGAATVVDFPRSATFLKDGSPDVWADLSRGAATWTVESNSEGVWEVDLRFEGGNAQLVCVDGGEGLQLFVNYSDPDLHERVTFSRSDG